jgi:hypothetical protein
MRENLVEPATEHHVAAEKQGQSVVQRWPARSLGHPFTA